MTLENQKQYGSLANYMKWMVTHKCIWWIGWFFASKFHYGNYCTCDEFSWPVSLCTNSELDYFVKCVTCFWYIVLQLFCRSSDIHKSRPTSSHVSALNRCIHHLPWFICFIMYAVLVVLPRDIPDRIIRCFSAISVVVPLGASGTQGFHSFYELMCDVLCP